MIAIGRTLKALPLPISALALRQPSRIQKRLLSARAARTSQQQSAHARSGVPPIGKPPAAPSSVDQHGTAEPISLANGPYRQSKAVPERKLPANYNAVARRVTAIIVALPIFIVTSYVLFERLVLGKEVKTRPGKTPLKNDNTSRDSLITEPELDGNQHKEPELLDDQQAEAYVEWGNRG